METLTLHPHKGTLTAIALTAITTCFITSMTWVISTASAGPTAYEVARGALQTTYDSADIIQGHCTAISSIVEEIKGEAHKAVESMGK